MRLPSLEWSPHGPGWAHIRRGFFAILLALAGATLVTAPALAQNIEYDLDNLGDADQPAGVAGGDGHRVRCRGQDRLRRPRHRRRAADHRPVALLVGKSFGTTTVNLYSAEGAPVGLLAVEVGADTADMARSIRAAVPSSERQGQHRQRPHPACRGTGARRRSRCRRCSTSSASTAAPPIINTMTLSGGQQVNLEVRILEAQRDAGRELGISWGGSVGGVNDDDRRRASRSGERAPSRSRPSSPASFPASPASASTPPSMRSRPRASCAPSPSRT